MKPQPWNSVGQSVYHTHPDCTEGQRARIGIWYGTGNKPLCPQCARLIEEDARAAEQSEATAGVDAADAELQDRESTHGAPPIPPP